MSQKAYIEKILERFNIANCFAGIVPIQKGNKFSLMQCPKNDIEHKQMESIPYGSIMSSLMYVQTCTRPKFCDWNASRYQSNLKIDH